jgi:internalin A
MMSKSPYEFADPKKAFAQAERRIEAALASRSDDLYLDSLGLRELPRSILQLEHLRELSLSENRLTSVPKWLGQLTRLHTLTLWVNSLEELPESIGELIRLERLGLHSNKLASLPESMRRLTALKIVYLDRNRLESLPAWIGSWTQLTTLSVSNNQLCNLPQSLSELKRLTFLGLQGNIGLKLPLELLVSGRASRILDYYFRMREAARPLNEAKLILLGRGEVGKTCLVNRVVHDKYINTDMTRGIAITEWHTSTGSSEVRFHVWDFGGQEIQHATHQFFLTERSLYLVVLNGRAGAEDDDAEYWLKFVKTFGGSSPTIVVLNKFQVQPFNVDRYVLQEKYPFIRAFVETDCKPNGRNGIPELRQQIKASLADMEHVRTPFPACWFEIKNRLAGMKDPFISFAEYRELCAELGEADEDAQEQLAGSLNALGIALNFRDDRFLRDETVLNPHWITDGVYRIITNKPLATRQGELQPADLTIILPHDLYPKRMHEFLIELMRKFELCFPFHDDPKEHRYLVPELLGKEQPKLKDKFAPAECLNFRYDYRLMPEGLLPRFITRTHTMSRPAERWRTGVVLRWEGARALVRADKQERQVLVRVFGEVEPKRRLLAVIRENFDQIHTDMREFKPTEWVAVERHPDEWVSYLELEVFEKQQIPEFNKSIGDEVVRVDVKKVLDATEVPGARRRDELPLLRDRPLKLFISYAHEDEKWRAKLAPNLDLLQREGLVEVWYDLKIRPGDNWDHEIKDKLESAELYLFLLSTDLLVSEYVQRVEFPIALARHNANQARLVPVVVRKCSWSKYLGHVQALPAAGKPVKQWTDKDQACHDVEVGLRETIAKLQQLLRS